VNRDSARKSIGVARHYVAALQDYLARRPLASLRTAGTVGRRAAAAGLETSDLARIHKRALFSLVPPGDSSRNNNGKIARAATFFIEALRPFENTQRAAVQNNGHLNRLKGRMRRRTLELADAKRQLKSEFTRRRSLEAALKTSEQHYGQLLKRSRHMQEQMRRLSHEILSAQEEERKRISRELHDEIGQTLTAINVKLATLKQEATVTTKGFKKAISSTQRLVERSMNTVHRFARELRPPLLDDLGLIPALHAHMKTFTRRTGIPVQFKTFAAVETLGIDARTVLYRVAQESFSNIARHAHATLVNVDMRRVKSRVRMEIHDNGISFDVTRLLVDKRIVRLGLLGMRERVEMVGGSFDVESEPGSGTTIRAEIPFDGREGSPRAPNRVPTG
jgi:signal transduction histidine kinase